MKNTLQEIHYRNNLFGGFYLHPFPFFAERTMSLYTDYLEQIETRKEQGLHPKPIEYADLVEVLIAQIKDTQHEHREGAHG